MMLDLEEVFQRIVDGGCRQPGEKRRRQFLLHPRQRVHLLTHTQPTLVVVVIIIIVVVVVVFVVVVVVVVVIELFFTSQQRVEKCRSSCYILLLLPANAAR